MSDDPHVGPAHLPDPDVGGRITIDDQGHVRAIDVDIPGTAQRSDPAHIEFGGSGSSTSPSGPGWMPNVTDPNAQPLDPFSLPPRPGWHRDPITGVEYPDVVDGGGSAPDSSGLGDYPDPDQSQGLA